MPLNHLSYLNEMTLICNIIASTKMCNKYFDYLAVIVLSSLSKKNDMEKLVIFFKPPYQKIKISII